MRYNENGAFGGSTARANEICEVLKKIPPNYSCYISHVDAIYPAEEFGFGIVGEGTEASIASRETYGQEPKKILTVSELLDVIPKCLKECGVSDAPVYAEAAADVDAKLDMQLDETMGICSWGRDDVCEILYLITGMPYSYC